MQRGTLVAGGSIHEELVTAEESYEDRSSGGSGELVTAEEHGSGSPKMGTHNTEAKVKVSREGSLHIVQSSLDKHEVLFIRIMHEQT